MKANTEHRVSHSSASGPHTLQNIYHSGSYCCTVCKNKPVCNISRQIGNDIKNVSGSAFPQTNKTKSTHDEKMSFGINFQHRKNPHHCQLLNTCTFRSKIVFNIACMRFENVPHNIYMYVCCESVQKISCKCCAHKQHSHYNKCEQKLKHVLFYSNNV